VRARLRVANSKSGSAFNAYAASIAEANIGIICACAPSLRTVFHNFFKKTFTKNSNNSSGNNSSASTVLNPLSWARRCFKGQPPEGPAENNWPQDKKQQWSEDMKSPTGGTPIPLGSFVQAHEEGLQSPMSPVVEGYDQPISPRPVVTPGLSIPRLNLVAPMPAIRQRREPSPSYSSSSDERRHARRSMRTFWKTANKPAGPQPQPSRESWRARQALWSRAYRMDSDVRAEDEIEIARPVARTTYPAI